MIISNIPKWERIFKDQQPFSLKENDKDFLLEFFFEAVHNPQPLITFLDNVMDLINIDEYVEQLNYDQKKILNYIKYKSNKYKQIIVDDYGIHFKLSSIPGNPFSKYTDIQDCSISLVFINSAQNKDAYYNSSSNQLAVFINLNPKWIHMLHPFDIKNYITHELTHYFNFIRSKSHSIDQIAKIQSSEYNSIVKLIKVYSSKEELDAQINELARVSRTDPKWNSYSFLDIIVNTIGTLLAVLQRSYYLYNQLSSELQIEVDKLIHNMLIQLYKRMARENLIGQNMKWNGEFKTLKSQFINKIL